MTYPESFKLFCYGKTKNRPFYIDLKGRISWCIRMPHLGKSAVLKELYRVAKNEAKMSHHQGFPNCNSYAIHGQLMAIQGQGLKLMFLIDKVSMISGTILTDPSNSLQETEDVDSVVGFGGYL
ncbi:hypothetical protein BGZ46_002092, partial [Entomortierella lignicola]